MHINIEEFLHSRVREHCLKLYEDGYYPQSAHAAMNQVELALKERISPTTMYGVKLIRQVFGKANDIHLVIPLGDDLQDEARTLFEGAFAYYRNYTAHDGANVDKIICLRVMILASELLDLIGASARSFIDLGGPDGLIKAGVFCDTDHLKRFLGFLDGQTFPDNVCDGFYEQLYNLGFTDDQLEAVLDLGLIQYRTYPIDYSPLDTDMDLSDEIGIMELTELGNFIIGD